MSGTDRVGLARSESGDVIATSSGFALTTAEYGFGVPMYHLVRADLDRDGRTDVLAFATGQGTGLLNNGNGTLSPQTTFALDGTLPYSLAIADLDHDGAPDLFAASRGALQYLRGKGDGTFAAAVTIDVPNSARIDGADAGDLDGDGNVDLVRRS